MSQITLAHLSDPHFGTVPEKVQNGLIETLRALRPDIVLISGDITQRARRRQFEAAHRFKLALEPVPFFAVPGNHDIPLFNLFGRLVHPYYGFHRYFQSARETDLCLNDVRIIGLNSTSRWRHVQGNLDIGRVRDAFLSGWDNSRFRIAMIHHPLACAKPVDAKNRLTNHEATSNFFSQAKIDLVLSGHVHDPLITVENNLILSVAGTCLSTRTRKGVPNSFNWIEVETEPKTVTVTRLDIADNLYHPRPDWKRAFHCTQTGKWLPL